MAEYHSRQGVLGAVESSHGRQWRCERLAQPVHLNETSHLIACSTPSLVGMWPRADRVAHRGGVSFRSTNRALDTS